jgi:ribonuclease HI
MGVTSCKYCIFMYKVYFFFLMEVSFICVSYLWNMSRKFEVYVGLVDGARRHTQRLSFIAWVIFVPIGHLVSSGCSWLGEENNNVVEYSVIIEILPDALSHGISHLQVYLDAQLVVSQLNGVYHVDNCVLHRHFLKVCLLEHYFYYITYIHVPRCFNQLIDALENHVLDWHL